MPPTRPTCRALRGGRPPRARTFFRAAQGPGSKRPAPGSQRPRLSGARIGLYSSPSSPFPYGIGREYTAGSVLAQCDTQIPYTSSTPRASQRASSLESPRDSTNDLSARFSSASPAITCSSSSSFASSHWKPARPRDISRSDSTNATASSGEMPGLSDMAHLRSRRQPHCTGGRPPARARPDRVAAAEDRSLCVQVHAWNRESHVRTRCDTWGPHAHDARLLGLAYVLRFRLLAPSAA
ncbi:hypothetical protein emb_1c0018 [Coriobacteriaceae bacterium EMTCatB1]|nr:hypothetical protein emb_1c0018 [Coriobacteriaceae bacterium EMTCatB1]